MNKNHWGAYAIIAAIIAAVALVIYLTVTPAAAQTSESNSTSGSAANVATNTAAGAISRTSVNNPESAPGVASLALGGSHPCAYSPAGISLSVVGGGGAIGGQRIDNSCLLLIEGLAGDARAMAAANYMIAARDPAACTAMQASGMVASCVKAGTKPVQRQASSGVARCEFNAKGQLIKVRVTADQNRADAINACRASR